MSNAKRVLPALWALMTVGIVGGVVWVGLLKTHALQSDDAIEAATPPAVTRPATAKIGHDYYVLVKLVEFNPRKPNGDYWDVRGGAPDAKVLLYWHGQQVFALPQREDQLISTWDLFRVNVVEVATNGGNVDVASSINAPIVRVEPGMPVTVEVWDADLIRDDLALKIDLPLQDLIEGENDIPMPPHSGLRRLVVQLIDRETSLSDLIKLAGKR